MSAPHPLPEALSQALGAYDRRRRRVLLWRGIGEAVAVGGVALAGVAAIDLFLRPGLPTRLTLSAAAATATVGVLVLRGLLPALRRRQPAEVARSVERAAGGLDERLSAAVEFAATTPLGVSAWMVNRTIALAANDAANLDARALVDARPARRALRPAGALLALLGASAALPGVPALYARALLPWTGIARPARTRLAVDPGDRLAALGSALAIEVAAAPDADSAEIDIVWQDGLRETAAMERAGARWRWQLGAVTRPFAYVVRAGDAESPRFRIGVVAPPRVEHLRLRITPPAYSGRPGREIDGGDAEIIAGSVVALVAELGGDPVASATVVGGDGDEQAAFLEPAQAGEPARARAELRPAADFTYGLRLVGASGFASESTRRWLIKVAPDAPPSVAIAAPGLASGLVGADESVPVTVTAADDLGLKRVELVVTREQETSTRPLAPPQGGASAAIATAIDLRGWDAASGDALTVVATATDVGGQTTRSAPLTLTVAGGADGAAAAEAVSLRSLLAVINAQSTSLAALARTWTALGRSGDQQDAIERRGGLALIADRATAWETALVAAAEASIDEDARDRDGGLQRLAHELRCWTQAEAEQARSLARQAATQPALLADGAAVAEAALQDLAAFRHDLATLASRCDAEALAGRSDGLAARAERAAAVLRADLAWSPPSFAAGLAATFFRGTELQGEPVAREVGLPAIAQRQVAGIGGENFSARWEGEVQIPSAGDWTFQATADDGVRLAVDGQDLLAPAAWAMQAPTAFAGTVHLEPGWHRLRVEYMQGAGGSLLQLVAGPAGGELAPLTPERLRCREAGPAEPALAQAMTRLDPAVVKGAVGRLARALGDLAEAAQALRSFSDAAPSDQLKRIAQEGATSADALTALAAHRERWADAELAGVGSAAAASATTVRSARDQLVEAAKEVMARRPALGPFPALQEALKRSHDRLERILHLPGDLPEADRRQAATRGMSATRSWFEQMVREAPRARARLLDLAQAGGADARTAVAEARASRTLGAMTQLLREALARIDRIKDPYHELGEVLQYWQRLEDLLRDGMAREAEAHRFARADAARSASEELRALLQAESDGHPVEADRRARALLAQARSLAEAERAEEKDAVADELERLAAGVGAAPDTAPALEAKLRQFDTQDRAWPADSSAEMAAALQSAAQRLAQSPPEQHAPARDEARLDARESAVASAAEGERRREADAKSRPAAGFAALALDLDRFAASGTDARDLTALAGRAAALSGAKGPQEQAAAEGTPAPPAAPAEELERLAAAAAAAADHADHRESVQEQLRAAAGVEARPDASAAARAVAAALERLEAAAAAEAAARRRFADTQAEAASAADELAAQAAREAQAAQNQADRAALAAASDPATRAAAAARELGVRSADQAIGAEQLAAQARAQAETIAGGIAKPLAEALRSADPADAEGFSRVGRQASAAAALERRAADELERVERERIEARRQLAGAVLASGVPEVAPAAAATEAQAAGAQHQAAAAIAEAEQRWREAAAQAAHAAASPGDAGADQQSAQARAAALEAQVRALQAAAGADQRRAAVAAALQPPNAPDPSLAAAQVQQAAAAEQGAVGLAELASAIAPEAAAGARLSAQPPAAAGRAAEAPLRAAATAILAAAPPIAPEPSSSQSPAAVASRAALSGITAAPKQADSYHTASRILADAAQAERMAAATPLASAQARADGGTAGPTGETHASDSGPGSAADLPPNPGGPDQADWARLPEQAERRARAEGVERFSEEQQEAIRAYLRRLGEEK